MYFIKIFFSKYINSYIFFSISCKTSYKLQKYIYTNKKQINIMKCKYCGCINFSIGNDNTKYCKNCGIVSEEIWNKTDRLIG